MVSEIGSLNQPAEKNFEINILKENFGNSSLRLTEGRSIVFKWGLMAKNSGLFVGLIV